MSLPIQIDHVTKRYPHVTVLDQASFQWRPGEVSVLLGPNGTGKTTLLKILSGLLSVNEGTVRIGEWVYPADSDRVRAVTGVVFEDSGFYPHMSVSRYLAYFSALHRVPDAWQSPRIRHLAEEWGLTRYWTEPVTVLSRGNKQKVSIMRALLADPPLLLLDEPTANLDDDTSTKVLQFLRDQAHSGKTVLIGTHNFDDLDPVADRVMILRQGHFVADYTMETLHVPHYHVEMALVPGLASQIATRWPTGAVTATDTHVTWEWTGTPHIHEAIASLLALGATLRHVHEHPSVTLKDLYRQFWSRNGGETAYVDGREERMA